MVRKRSVEVSVLKVERIVEDDWWRACNLARKTQGKPPLPKGHEVSHSWREKVLRARHSPIRLITYQVELRGIPYWLSVHLVRHKIGIEHFVVSQRDDITGVPRDQKPQGALVDHIMVFNADALIAISLKRLCHKAHEATRKVWEEIVETIVEMEPYYEKVLQPPCKLYGVCMEMKSCGRLTKD